MRRRSGRWCFSLIRLSKSDHGPNAECGFEFSPAAKLIDHVSQEVALGVEYYAPEVNDDGDGGCLDSEGARA
jgi:hypothetical protein